MTSYANQKLSSGTIFLTSSERRRVSDTFGLFGRSDHIGESEGREVGVTWAQSKSHHFVNTADTFRERSHTHKSMQHVRPTGISKPELWIL